MTWDFPEANPLSEFHCAWHEAYEWVSKAIETLAAIGRGSVAQDEAATQMRSAGKLVSTDPPYYDNIGYADLSDFFYIWLRRSQRGVCPDLFTTLAGLPDIPYDKDAPWEWADAARKALMSMSGNSIRGIAVGDVVKLRDEFLKLLAAMEWYGIDLPPNRARAAMSLLLCEDRRTQAISAGYMLSQLTEDERGSFDTFIDFLENIPDN